MSISGFDQLLYTCKGVTVYDTLDWLGSLYCTSYDAFCDCIKIKNPHSYSTVTSMAYQITSVSHEY